MWAQQPVVGRLPPAARRGVQWAHADRGCSTSRPSGTAPRGPWTTRRGVLLRLWPVAVRWRTRGQDAGHGGRATPWGAPALCLGLLAREGLRDSRKKATGPHGPPARHTGSRWPAPPSTTRSTTGTRRRSSRCWTRRELHEGFFAPDVAVYHGHDVREWMTCLAKDVGPLLDAGVEVGDAVVIPVRVTGTGAGSGARSPPTSPSQWMRDGRVTMLARTRTSSRPPRARPGDRARALDPGGRPGAVRRALEAELTERYAGDEEPGEARGRRHRGVPDRPRPVGAGGRPRRPVRTLAGVAVEIKRMYVRPERRGEGVGGWDDGALPEAERLSPRLLRSGRDGHLPSPRHVAHRAAGYREVPCPDEYAHGPHQGGASSGGWGSGGRRRRDGGHPGGERGRGPGGVALESNVEPRISGPTLHSPIAARRVANSSRTSRRKCTGPIETALDGPYRRELQFSGSRRAALPRMLAVRGNAGAPADAARGAPAPPLLLARRPPAHGLRRARRRLASTRARRATRASAWSAGVAGHP